MGQSHLLPLHSAVLHLSSKSKNREHFLSIMGMGDHFGEQALVGSLGAGDAMHDTAGPPAARPFHARFFSPWGAANSDITSMFSSPGDRSYVHARHTMSHLHPFFVSTRHNPNVCQTISVPWVQVSLKLEHETRELVVVRQDNIGILRSFTRHNRRRQSERGNETAAHPVPNPIGSKPQRYVCVRWCI